MPDNLDAPTNVVLAGTYQATSEVQAREKIRIWHRFFNNEKDYLVVMHSGSDVHWVHITDSQAHWVWHNRPPLTKDDILKIEWRIQSDIVEWDMKAAEQAASDDNDIFDSLNYWQ